MGLRIKHGTSAQLNSPASIARYRAEKTLQYSKIQYRYVSLVSCWFVLANKSKPSRSCCHRLKSLTIYPRGETAKGPGFELSHWATVGNPETTVKLQALQTATSLSCIIWSHTLRRSWQMHRVATFRALGEAFSFFRSFTTAGCFRCIYQGHRRSVPVGECPWSVRRAPGVRAPQKVSAPLDTLSHCTDMHWESTHKLRVHSTVEIQDTHTLCNFKHIIYIPIHIYIYVYTVTCLQKYLCPPHSFIACDMWRRTHFESGAQWGDPTEHRVGGSTPRGVSPVSLDLKWTTKHRSNVGLIKKNPTCSCSTNSLQIRQATLSRNRWLSVFQN